MCGFVILLLITNKCIIGTTVEQIESYFISVEEFLSSSLTSVAPDLPHLHEIANRIWADITRFGPPSLPQLPGLGSFEVPPSPPLPPPTPPTWSESLGDWASEHKLAIAGASVGLVGAGILAGYSTVRYRRNAAIKAKRKDTSKDRREVVGTSLTSPRTETRSLNNTYSRSGC